MSCDHAQLETTLTTVGLLLPFIPPYPLLSLPPLFFSPLPLPSPTHPTSGTNHFCKNTCGMTDCGLAQVATSVHPTGSVVDATLSNVAFAFPQIQQVHSLVPSLARLFVAASDVKPALTSEAAMRVLHPKPQQKAWVGLGTRL